MIDKSGTDLSHTEHKQLILCNNDRFLFLCRVVTVFQGRYIRGEMNVINAPRRGRRRGQTEEVPLAPPYQVPDQEIFAVEHPMIIQNLDRALKTFGNNRPFRRVSAACLTRRVSHILLSHIDADRVIRFSTQMIRRSVFHCI